METQATTNPNLSDHAPMTEWIIHRINSVEALRTVPHTCGVEIDIRGFGDELVLTHDPVQNGREYERLIDFLAAYRHGTLVCNLKEAGYEKRVLTLLRDHGVARYFLLDVEFPYLYRATRALGVREIAVRYSEAEPIEAVQAQIDKGRPLLDWVWIDTNTRLPLDSKTVEILAGFRTCLVCPERWGRPEDIPIYRKQMEALHFQPTAVMTSIACLPQWLEE